MASENNNVLNYDIKFTSIYKLNQLKGNLVYEYNPFRNYRLLENCFEDDNKIYKLKDLLNKGFELFGTNGKSITEPEKIELQDLVWKKDGKTLNESEAPILRRKGELVDFDTDELKFSLTNPVDLLPQYSYDGSVNLIVNDGKNIPRLINSRFSPLGKNKYLVVDRKGDNDTNIYDLGELFDIDTSLYKRTNYIPKLKYYGTFSSGSLPIGNYHFYFKYMDADGNETDFIAESGLVSVFIGNDPCNIQTGFRELNSYKGVSFLLSNIDAGYLYVSVYYTRATSDIFLNSVTIAKKIDQKYLVNSANMCSIKITGYEPTIEITTDEINLLYLVAGSVNTLTQCLNRLFLGNITKPDINYLELEDISLRICPKTKTESYNISEVVSEDYTTEAKYNKSYYNSTFIYDRVGYYPGEIYRFGIVYILKDNTLSPVFNIRGQKEINGNTKYTEIKFFTENDSVKKRNYISYNEEDYLLVPDKNDGSNSSKEISTNLENVKGVVSIKNEDTTTRLIYGITFTLQDKDDCLNKLYELGIKGYFFVRQKRIPTTLCEAFTIGVDKQSHTPVIPKDGKYIAESFLNQSEDKKYLTHDYEQHKITLDKSNTDVAAICPEYDVNTPYLNTLFSGDKYVILKVADGSLSSLSYNDRAYYCNEKLVSNYLSYENCSIIGVEDNVKLVSADEVFYSARAGEAEEAFRYEYCQHENVVQDATNLLRGSFGPYIGIPKCSFKSSIISIKIPDYNPSNMQDYFKIRYDDKAPYFSICDRNSIDNIKDNNTCYRGDSYICQFTHRINRNFQDPSSPVNDKIVDKKCWKNNYKVTDGVANKLKFEDINLGDVNAVKLGLWITFTVRSSMNLNIRSIDESQADEIALTGHPRTFFPNAPLSCAGVYKVPEALCYNKGFLNSVSDRYNFELPNVPAIKNDFTNRIAYSDIHVNDAFKNGFRVFQSTHFKDYPKTYGQITKIVELEGNILVVFEHGISLVSVNERAVATNGSGGSAFINTPNVLPENPTIISDKYGSLWKDSIVKTPSYIYGVDTVAKKIWRVSRRGFECISDFRINSFLNKNISLTERETEPIIGIRNVKSHFNAFKNDVLFTFYDNLHGFEEKVWNICFNEMHDTWVTFYSWVPSFSENIYNQFFTFDRNTSKWLAKLGISNKENSFADGIVLDKNIIDKNNWKTEIDLVNRNLPGIKGTDYTITYTLERDNLNNRKYFEIVGNTLYFTGNYEDICAEIYLKNDNGNYILDEYGRKIELDEKDKKNQNKLVYLLNIKASISINTEDESLKEAYSLLNGLNAGYYLSVVAVMPKANEELLTTAFWRHGLSGIVDKFDKLKPCFWYNKQHPFEFEFIVSDEPTAHKIFDNLEIIGNNAEPESFHYEIIGDCYDFAKDKKNMYIRLEATKELYLYNGVDICYDNNYSNLKAVHNHINGDETKPFEPSTLFPLYYERRDTYNEIEDYYQESTSTGKNYDSMSGAEIVHNETYNDYRICEHAKAVDITKEGRLRGNMLYLEDKWYVQINPINFILKNEDDWKDETGNKISIPPVILGEQPLPSELDKTTIEVPKTWIDTSNNKLKGYNYTVWKDNNNKEVKVKDKFVRIKVRYKGDKFAVISAIQTLFNISYS